MSMKNPEGNDITIPTIQKASHQKQDRLYMYYIVHILSTIYAQLNRRNGETQWRRILGADYRGGICGKEAFI